MKKIIFCAAILFTFISSVSAQEMASRYKPYRNLAVWYGTQSAPEPLEKAKWGLDDLNAYRLSKGLPEYPLSILDSETAYQSAITTSRRPVRLRLFRFFR